MASIEESEEPKWDFVANAHLDIVVCDKAVGRVLYLPKRLALASNLEKPLPVNQKISLRRTGHRMPCRTKLVHEEGLP